MEYILLLKKLEKKLKSINDHGGKFYNISSFDKIEFEKIKIGLSVILTSINDKKYRFK